MSLLIDIVTLFIFLMIIIQFITISKSNNEKKVIITSYNKNCENIKKLAQEIDLLKK